MPAVEDVIHMEYQSSHRLGLLWRSQGREFLDAQAAALIDDVDRLRESYVKASDQGAVIDLRDWDVTGMVCSREDHGNVAAAARCKNCRLAYCAGCVVRREATEALCTECALVLGGIHHKRSRPLVAPGRPGRSTRR